MRNQKLVPAIALVIALLIMLIPAAALGQTSAVGPIHQLIRQAGIHVDNLKVIPVEGIIIVRGTVHDEESLNRVSALLRQHGYLRVANLLKIAPIPNDQAIARAAERQLAITRALDGARLTVQSRDGIVTINGRIRYELQRDAAINIVRGVDGVRDVRVNLGRM